MSTIEAIAHEAAIWRRQLHEIPELLFDLPLTSAFVAEKLRSFGCGEVVEGIGGSGVVGVVTGKLEGDFTYGLRADMDALPITETTGKSYASKHPGRMHACGHDGHTAMLLGAAKFLCGQRNFPGKRVLIFQPAEEGGGGADVMIQDGLMERFGIQKIFALHNRPGLAAGHFATRAGAIMAGNADFTIRIDGSGGHAGRPHQTRDPVVAAGHLIVALQGIVSRNVDPLKSAVLSIGMIHGGSANNIIPQSVELGGTVRFMDAAIEKLLHQRMDEVCRGVSSLSGTSISLDYRQLYPVTVNDSDETRYAVGVAARVVGAERVNAEIEPVMGSEDFSFMLNQRPGAYMLIGNGDSAPLHNSAYDFCDDSIISGMRYFIEIGADAQSS